MATPSDPWTLNRAALASLIARLDGGDAREYEVIRRKLIAFLDLRGAAHPETAADETVDRVARKLQEGVPIQALRAYVFGVARRVLMESARRTHRDRVTQQTWVLLRREPGADEETERRFACLEKCLGALSPEDRSLVEAYHGAGASAGHDARAALAARFGISGAALRTRVYRLRNQLGACLAGCLGPSRGDE